MAKKFKKAKSTAPEGFSDKHWNKLNQSWRDGAQTKSTEELEQEILKSCRSITQQTKDMKEDPKLCVLQEDLKALKGGYTEVISEEKARIEFCLFSLETRGQKVKRPKEADESDEDDE